MTPSLVPEPFDGEAARQLAAAATADAFQIYGEPSSEEPPTARDFEPPQGAFFVAYDGDLPIGCGGFKRLALDVVELKRMYVCPGARGGGAGRAILAALEQAALAAGARIARLETGTRNTAALGLYRSSGYEPIPCWGRFATDPKSVCLEKRL